MPTNKFKHLPKILKYTIISFLALFVAVILKGYGKLSENKYYNIVASISVSPDAKFAISTHHGKLIVLWDLEHKKSKLLSIDANIYSAYFLENSHQFMWQAISNNDVHVTNLNGQDDLIFNPGFSSYGQLLSNNKKIYIASDKEWNIYTISKGYKQHLKSGFHDDNHGKIINLSISNNLLLSSGVCNYRGDDNDVSEGLTGRDLNSKIPEHVNYSLMRGIILWDLNTGKAIRKFNGNSVKTHATLSPDGKYVVSGDENTLGFVWETETGKQVSELYDLKLGEYFHETEDKPAYFGRKNVISRPKDFCWQINEKECLTQESIIAMKFINNSQFLRFTNHVPYAILYDVTSPRHKKYLKLEGNPSVTGFNAPSYISTAPDKNLLVMGSAKDEGIRVYQFNPKDETLKLVWAPTEIHRTFKQKLQRLWQKMLA